MLAPWQLDSRVRRHFLPRNSIWQINEYQIDRPISVSAVSLRHSGKRDCNVFFPIAVHGFFFHS